MTKEHKGHQHTHKPSANVGATFMLGVGINLAYVIFEAICGWRYNSMALLSDAGHNLTDVLSLGLSALAFRLAQKAPTHTLTYGLGKSTIIISLVNSIILLMAMGALFFEATNRLLHPIATSGQAIGWVAAVGIVVNAGSALLFMRHGGELNSRGAFLHLAGDAAVSAGVLIVGVILAYYPVHWLDAVSSMAIAIIVVVASWNILKKSLRLSLDGVPYEHNVADVEALITKVNNVNKVHHLHIWALTTSASALTAHIVINESVINKMPAIKQDIRHELATIDIHHSTLEFEFDSEKGEMCHTEHQTT